MCRRNKENRSVTARHRSSQAATNGDELREDKDKDKDKDKDYISPPISGKKVRSAGILSLTTSVG